MDSGFAWWVPCGCVCWQIPNDHNWALHLLSGTCSLHLLEKKNLSKISSLDTCLVVLGGAWSHYLWILLGFFWCNSGTSLLDIGSQSSFNEATTTARLCFFRELWIFFRNPNTDWVLLFCPLSGICRSGGGETLSFSTWRWPVWWGWRDWEALKAVLLQLLVVPDHRRQHNFTHIACLCGRSCELWVGLWNSHCWSCNCHSHLPFWNSLVQTPACDPRKPSYTSSPSSDCCSSQFQSGSTHWSITASWDRYAEADQEESEEETPSPHWFLKVKKIVATSFINIGLMCFLVGNLAFW